MLEAGFFLRATTSHKIRAGESSQGMKAPSRLTGPTYSCCRQAPSALMESTHLIRRQP